ncbi:MAG: glycosyltransferase family 4 protein, partial [Planctomycetales bacterium]|nr:glycosyltransferase family 4 protein [Planctomycetales bacterium]
SDLGGANTEAWHTLRLWREGGLEVHALPTWRATEPWRKRLDAIGVITHDVPEKELTNFTPLRGAVCVSFCNDAFLRVVPRLRALDCRLVWVNCMTWLFDAERRLYDRYGPFDAYVFQSNFQRTALEPEMAVFGYQAHQGHTIRGAFSLDEWEFRPRPFHGSGSFVVGRLARPDPDKWHARMWEIYARIDYPERKAKVMGWNGKVDWKCGPPPKWATCLRPNAEKTQDFFADLHCLLTVNGGARENWPRIGLEAMAAGVPIVTENRWGWQEMIEHGKTGLLANSEEELSHHTSTLARDPALRMRLIHAARHHLLELCNPQRLYTSWSRLFASLAA